MVEGDGEGVGVETVLIEQVRGDDDDGFAESEERDGVGSSRHGEHGCGFATLQEFTGAAAGACEPKCAQDGAGTAEQGECHPQTGGQGEEEAKSADVFGFLRGFEAKVRGDADGGGEEQRDKRGSELYPVKNAFAASGGR